MPLLMMLSALPLGGALRADNGFLPDEPVAIGGEPQFLFDLHIVDNTWPLKLKQDVVKRVVHQAEKPSADPLLTGDQPSFLWVLRDDHDGWFKMWYQANVQVRPDDAKGRKYQTVIAFARSRDGIAWEKPDLDLFDIGLDLQPNNIVIGAPGLPDYESSAPAIVEVPDADKRGYRFVMLYRKKGTAGDISALNGMRLIGSPDGIHWDMANSMRVAHLHSDHHNTLCYDPSRGEYVIFCRPKHIYRIRGEEMIDKGASRRVARLASRELWTDWLEHSQPQTILVPDETDAQTRFNFFYGMPTRYYAGVYWGFLEPFRLNDLIYTELAVSRDGIQFQRLPGRAQLIEYGAEGTWDDTMIFCSPSWLEVGAEWWLYYSGWDGPHGTTQRTGGIGLATIRKEGFISLRGPQQGGVVCTRRLLWPGGDLLVNADATGGKLQVRVSTAERRPVEGFDYDDCDAFDGNDVRHRVTWNGTGAGDLQGREIRLEFLLHKADLYTFRASGP